jgi:hypothetical protein
MNNMTMKAGMASGPPSVRVAVQANGMEEGEREV